MTKLYWLAHCGNHAIERTSCMVEVEHFTDAKAFDDRQGEVMQMHESGGDEVESYQYGEVVLPDLSPSMVPHAYIQTAMALWEAVLDRRAAHIQHNEENDPLLTAFNDAGFFEMRNDCAALIPACEAAWEKIKDDYTDAWDLEFLSIIVSLWIEADFDASAVTVEKIVAAAATGKGD